MSTSLNRTQIGDSMSAGESLRYPALTKPMSARSKWNREGILSAGSRRGASSDISTFYEFFAGGGMARAGLGTSWKCLFANDIDPKKAAAYCENWGSGELVVCDVAQLRATELPGLADLAGASFPCQDFSLAGAGAGLGGERSGAFWPFWRIVENLARDGRAPQIVVLENVCGALTSHGGADFAAIGDALARSGYRFGAVVIDAVAFVPQSRPRLFIIGALTDKVPVGVALEKPDKSSWHPEALVGAYRKLSEGAAKRWIWWKLPNPPRRKKSFADIIENEPVGVVWHTREQTLKLLGLMSEVNREKVREAQRSGGVVVGAVYKRTRRDDDGRKVQRAEVRFDDVAGCLRTPVGGSSRQSILIVEGSQIQSRLLSPREAARLMGLPESYKLPSNYNEAYHVAGDGLVVPVVRFLALHLLAPLLAEMTRIRKRAA